MSDAPWLSVIVPTHNGERWIGRALESICQSDARGIECIIIDSSPGEETLLAAARYSDRLSLRMSRATDMVSWVEKTNAAALLARGRYLSLLHQDDYWMPGRAASIERWLGQSCDAVLHIHSSYIVDRDGNVAGLWRCPLPAHAAMTGDAFLPILMVQNFIAIPAPVFSRDAFLATGGMDPSLWYTADWDLWLKLGATGKVLYHPEPLACFRVHGGSLTMAGSKERLHEMRTQQEMVVARHIERVPADSRASVLRLARTSIDVNMALAAAAGGQQTALFDVASAIIRLGPGDAWRYVHTSRLLERVGARIRARVSGRL